LTGTGGALLSHYILYIREEVYNGKRQIKKEQQEKLLTVGSLQAGQNHLLSDTNSSPKNQRYSERLEQLH
jgi:phage gp37-like protein